MENKITLESIAKTIGLEETENTLPNGRVVTQYVFDPERDSEKVFKAVEKMASNMGNHVVLDGPFPNWLLATVTHALHPRSVSVWNPMLGETLPCNGCYFGTKSKFEYEDLTVEGIVWLSNDLLHVNVEMAANVRDPKSLCAQLCAPALPTTTKSVVIKGRSIGAIVALLANAYAHDVKDVSVQLPNGDNVVVISHGGRSYGSVWK